MLVRTMAGIDPNAEKQANIEKLCDYYACDEEVLKHDFEQKGFTIDDVVSNECKIASTVADVVSNNVLEYWSAFINKQVKTLEQFMPHSDEVAFMLQALCKKLGVRKIITDKIDAYSDIFPDNDLPNAIADFSAMTLNNFVSTVGQEYMSDQDIRSIHEKAEACDVAVDFSSENSNEQRPISVIEALQAFDDASDPASVSITTLMKLPFWDNFQRWKNRLIIGLLYATDISHCDPVANKEIKELIDKSSILYTI